MKPVFILLLVLALTPHAPAATPMLWDAVADFSDKENPHGPWSYHFASHDPAYALSYGEILSKHVPDIQNLINDPDLVSLLAPAGRPFWAGHDIHGPFIGHIPFPLQSQTDMLSLHGPLFIRWTSPFLGLIHIRGTLFQWRPEWPDRRQVAWTLYKNGSLLSYGAVLWDHAAGRALQAQAGAVDLAAGSGGDDSLHQSVCVGDQIDLLVDGSGPNGNQVPTFASLAYRIEQVPEPQLDQWFSVSDQADNLIDRKLFQDAANFLQDKFSAYSLWRHAHLVEAQRTDSLLPAWHFYLARAKEALGSPPHELTVAYKLAAADLDNRAAALTWLFRNVPSDEYLSVIKDHLPRPAEYPFIVRQFKAAGDWPAFEIFLNALFSLVDDPVAAARSIEFGLIHDQDWHDQFLRYAQNHPLLLEFAFAQDWAEAQKYLAAENYEKAAEFLHDILKQCAPPQNKALVELQLCQTEFGAGRYPETIAALDKFIAAYRTTRRDFVRQALLLKGRAFIQLSQNDKAVAVFLSLMAQYPESSQAAEAVFFIGYSCLLQGQNQLAQHAFNVILRNYASSPYTPRAAQYLARIQNMTPKGI